MTTARCIYREEHDDAHLEIWDEDDRRSLWFDDVILQSEIFLYDPAVLPNPVNRAMLAHLVFDRPQQRVLLAGCGGGAIARWFHARAPQVLGDAVERSVTVARLAHEYFDFPRRESSNWDLLVEDVRDFLVHNRARYDFILVDIEENQESPDWLTSAEFLGHCRERLSAQGVLTVNLLVDDASATAARLQRVRNVFEEGLLLLDDPDHDNLLVLAFAAGLPARPAPARIDAACSRWGIDFHALSARMRWLEPAVSAEPAA